MRAKDILSREGIEYKTDIINNNLRAAGHVGGNSAAMGRGGGVKDNFKVLVEKKDREKAEYLLRQVR